jgi:hypothetical protein
VSNGSRIGDGAKKHIDPQSSPDSISKDHRQQRMAAKREEVVVGSNLLDVEDLGKQLAQGAFFLRRSRLISLSMHKHN